jgi:hypothetical protein
MDFYKLLAKMNELDKPVVESTIEECGEPMGMTPSEPPKAPPSMSINVNAQGLDDIQELMALLTKVNPDMISQKAPAEMPSLTPPGPSISSIGDLGDLDKGPLKMLPPMDDEPSGIEIDLDGGDEPTHDEPDADNMGGPSDHDADNKDSMSVAQGDVDNDGDHDMDDHEAEKDKPEDEGYDNRDAYQRDFDASQTGFGKPDREDDEGEDEQDESAGGFDQASTSPDPEFKSADYMINKLAGGLNKPKTMHKHSYRQGDNPMAMPESDLRAMIKAELAQRLAEATEKLRK